ncbi:type 2 periplasmic-binding domain-containing protein [Catalinimonas niigatensis]|uniref:hypothetical protein n=1 Tax=Catalinimonas niigatensis TaxID=1397264 RepID=UPI002665C6D6|nr:hypothetical protein [Catalinimonas niigatensis]WPP49757.1 hypothetical protein PZB72_24090 [Catalinimonas niigatensis]
MKSKINWLLILLLLPSLESWGQISLASNVDHTTQAVSQVPASKEKQEIVLVTGVRFSYPLVQQWIDEYATVNEEVQIVVESRGTTDPAKYDMLIEAYPHDEQFSKSREYVYLARYAVLPVANNTSAFARTYADKGLDKKLITQLFFHNIYADKDKEQKIAAPYTVYTRLQKAGSPIVFSSYFGYDQKDIKGKAVAGADEHLLKAILRDSTAISYLPLSLIYDQTSGKPVSGLSVLPVDLNNNGRVSEEEKIFDDLSVVLKYLEEKSPKERSNIPVEYLHLSVDKRNASPEAIAFIRWVLQNKLGELHDYGFLQAEPSRLTKENFERFASKYGQ